MAKRVDKPVFFAGSGLPMLVYYCAVGERKLQMIKAGPLRDIETILDGNPD